MKQFGHDIQEAGAAGIGLTPVIWIVSLIAFLATPSLWWICLIVVVAWPMLWLIIGVIGSFMKGE